MSLNQKAMITNAFAQHWVFIYYMFITNSLNQKWTCFTHSAASSITLYTLLTDNIWEYTAHLFLTN